MSDVAEHVVDSSSPGSTNALADVDVGSLILRVVLGIIFLGHGLQKLGWFDSGGYPDSIDSQKQLIEFFGYSSAGFLAWVITLTEIVAGVSLLLGLILPLGAAAAAGIMVEPILGYQWDNGLFGNAAAFGFEFSLIPFGAAIALAFIGPGRWSIDSVLGWRLSGRRWGLITLISALAVGIFVLQVWGLGVGGSPAPPPGP